MSTRAPVALGEVRGFSPPSRMRSRRCVGTELVGTITGDNGTITVSHYGLNPGLSGTFPRLSQEASVWEQYAFRKLAFSYVPACPTSTPGSIILSPEYDANDFLADNEAGLTNTQDAREGMPWSPFAIMLDSKSMHPMGPRKYIRSGSVAADLKTYDVGRLSVGRLANGTTGTIGKLWVEYDVEFYVPQTDSPTAPVSPNITAYDLASNQGFTNGVAGTVNLSELSTFTSNAFGMWSNTSGTITPPKGTYLVFVDIGSKDSTSELFDIYATVEKNAGAITVPIIQEQARGVTTGTYLALHIAGVVSVNGGDTV